MNKDMARMMEAMMGGKGEEEDRSNIASLDNRISLFDKLEDEADLMYNSGKPVLDIDPRSAESLKYGFYWANRKIDDLIDRNDLDFISNLQMYLNMNPLRKGEHGDELYCHRILDNQKISNIDKIHAIKLLSTYGFNINIKDRFGDTPMTKAIKTGNIGVANALLHNSRSLNVLDYIDSTNNNLLNLAYTHNQIDMIPFLLRKGLQPKANNISKDLLDLAFEDFETTMLIHKEPSALDKNTFNKLYTVLSSLRATANLTDSALKNKLQSMVYMDSRYESVFKDMISSVVNIKPTPVLNNTPSSVTNMGFGPSPMLVPTFSKTSLVGNNLQTGATTKFTEAAKSLTSMFDTDTWLISKYKLSSQSGFFNTLLNRKELTAEHNGSVYTDYKLFNLSSITDKYIILNNNIDAITKKINQNMANTEKNSELYDIYKSKLDRLQAINISNIDPYSIYNQISNIKNELCNIKMDASLSSLQKLVENGKLNIREMDLSIPVGNKDRDTILTMAAKNGHLPTIDYLMSRNCNLHESNIQGNTALHIAAVNGNLEMMNTLLGCWNGKEYIGMRTDPQFLNNEGKTFIDVLKESHPPEVFNKLCTDLCKTHPELEKVISKLTWDVPYWSAELSNTQPLGKDDNVPMLGMYAPALLHDANWFNKPEKPSRSATDSDLEDYYSKVNKTIEHINHSLLYDKDSLSDSQIKDLNNALDTHLNNLPPKLIMAHVIEYTSRMEKEHEHCESLRKQINAGLSNDVELKENLALSEKAFELYKRASESSINIMSDRLSGSNGEDIYKQFDIKDITEIIAGLNTFAGENNNKASDLKNILLSRTKEKYPDASNEIGRNESPSPKDNT